MLIVVSGPKVSLIRSIDLTISASTRWVSSSIRPELDGEIDEGAGGLNHALVVAQAHQRLDTLDVLGPDIDLGLEGAAEALFQDGQPQRLLDLHPRQRLALHAGVEERRGALAAVLDAVHRDVGVLAQHVVAAAVFGIEADADRGGGEDLRLVDEERRLQPLQHEVDEFRDFALVLDRIEQQQEFVAADPRQDVGFAQVEPKPLGHLDQQGVADRVAVIVVDMLEIVDVEKGQRETAVRAVALQKVVDAVFDHPPRRQAGQFVIIGRAEQVVLERLLFGDVGGAREQQIAFGDPDRPVRGEKHLFGLAVANGFFQHGGAAGAQQFETGFAAIAQLRSRRRGRGHLQQGRCGVVHQQELAVLVLNRHAGRKQSEDIPQDAQFGIESRFHCRPASRPPESRVCATALHSRGAWQSPL